MLKTTFRNVCKALVPYGIIWFFQRKKRELEWEKEKEKGQGLQFRLINRKLLSNVYGQFAEDLLLRLLYEKSPDYKGFYVDIGAFHPVIHSNTHYFYQTGWRGINIDANPHSIQELNKERKRDINVESGVSDQYGELEYYFFDDLDSRNSFDKKTVEEFEKNQDGTKIKEVKKIKVQPINAILEEYLPKGQHIDFMTIDVEGLELKILKSLDFSKYSPDYFLLEDLEFAKKGFEEINKSPLSCFLKEKGYEPIAVARDTTLLYRRLSNVV